MLKVHIVFQQTKVIFLGWSSFGSASLIHDSHSLTHSLTDSHIWLSLFQLVYTFINFCELVWNFINLSHLLQPMPPSTNPSQPQSISVNLSQPHLDSANLSGHKYTCITFYQLQSTYINLFFVKFLTIYANLIKPQ